MRRALHYLILASVFLTACPSADIRSTDDGELLGDISEEPDRGAAPSDVDEGDPSVDTVVNGDGEADEADEATDTSGIDESDAVSDGVLELDESVDAEDAERDDSETEVDESDSAAVSDDCSEGVCCDSGNFRGPSQRCSDGPVAVEYTCVGTACGGIAQRREQYRYCSGDSAECGSGVLRWGNQETLDDCEESELCRVTETSASCELCLHGCSEGECQTGSCESITCNAPDNDYCLEPEYLRDYESTGDCADGECTYEFIDRWCSYGCATRAEDDVCNSQCAPTDPCCDSFGFFMGSNERCGTVTTDTEFRCDSDVCGGDASGRSQYQYCTGTDSACERDNLQWEDWVVTDACTSSERCLSDLEKAYCESCEFGCTGNACVECAEDSHCDEGSWCDDGSCSSCNVDLHCGSSCEDCTPDGDSCSDDGTHCIECSGGLDCGLGAWCDDGTCRTCNTADHCSFFCWSCGGETPDCAGVLFGCVCNESSCGSSKTCESMSCEVCAQDSACGTTCGACASSAPRCVHRGTFSECVECTSNADCTGGWVCDEWNACVNPSSCDGLPSSACSNGSQSRESCADARVVSRGEAENGTTRSGDLYSAQDTDERCEGSDGEDHFYRIFMLMGETLTVSLDVDTFDGFDPVLVLFRSNTACLGAGCETESVCVDDWAAGTDEDFTRFTAPQDGWYIIKADAWEPIDTDQNSDYTLDIDLNCLSPGCGC